LLDKSYNFEKFNNSPIEDIRVIKEGLVDYYPRTRAITFQKGKPTTVWLLFDRSPKDMSIELSATGKQESRASRLNIELTDKVRDSLYKIDPDYFRPIEPFKITSTRITQNKVEFVIVPLKDMQGIYIHVEYGFPALIYQNEARKK
jgi:hypothetical protein